MKKALKETAAEIEQSTRTGGSAGASPGQQGAAPANQQQGMMGGTLTNLFVLIGFAAFAYTVKYVLRELVN